MRSKYDKTLVILKIVDTVNTELVHSLLDDAPAVIVHWVESGLFGGHRCGWSSFCWMSGTTMTERIIDGVHVQLQAYARAKWGYFEQKL